MLSNQEAQKVLLYSFVWYIPIPWKLCRHVHLMFYAKISQMGNFHRVFHIFLCIGISQNAGNDRINNLTN